jgi:hypothetical protein
MPSSAVLRRGIVGTDVSEERIASVIRVRRSGELGTALAATNNRRMQRRLLVAVNAVPRSPILVTLMMEELRSSETSVLAGTPRCGMAEDGILHSNCGENLRYYYFGHLCDGSY